MLLITDGGDHDSFPVEAAEALGQSGARILAIGLGDDTAGQPIPDQQQSGSAGAYVEHDGKMVLSALDADLLRAVAGATPAGRYVHWATGNLDLGRLYREMIAAAPGRLLEAEALELINERFQIFVGVALLLFAVAAAVPDRFRLPRLHVRRLGGLTGRTRTPEARTVGSAVRHAERRKVPGRARDECPALSLAWTSFWPRRVREFRAPGRLPQHRRGKRAARAARAARRWLDEATRPPNHRGCPRAVPCWRWLSGWSRAAAGGRRRSANRSGRRVPA